jgi:eukaryotic-like serine/threonine-protein kinase
MPLSAGDRLGPYEILVPIGAGGMGEVYKAHDTKLGRDVALKILPTAFANDPDRLARFEREARVLASLDHPNIGHIYGLEESNGTRALVLALIDGPTLADRIAQGSLPIEEVRNIALQIAEAFEYAHDRGVIHRDLKPANIKITPDGVVKVLDFGLAKALEAEEHAAQPGANSPTMLPTMSMGATQPGVILGTAAYISPEQVKGKRADRRSDIWAFGVVLYEMLTGKRPFDGESLGELLANVVKDEPQLEAVPVELRSLISRSLNKDPRKRLQSFGEARQILEGTFSGKNIDLERVGDLASLPAHSVRGSVSTSRLGWAGWIAAVLFALAALGIGIFHLREHPQNSAAVRLFLPPPEKTRFRNYAALSPDGRFLAFIAGEPSQLWVREMDSLTARPLPGTERAGYPFWSPDSRSIGFFTDGKLKKIDAAGGPAFTICDAKDSRGATWNQSGMIIFDPEFGTKGLFIVSGSGGAPVALTSVRKNANENSHRLPWFLPDGEHFLYTARGEDIKDSRVYFRSLKDQSEKLVLTVPSNVLYVSSGHVLFVREGSLLAQHVDPSNGVVSGEEIPIAEHVGFSAVNVQAAITASQTGTLAYLPSVNQNNQLTWFDRNGRMLQEFGEPATFSSPRISPDGNVIAYGRLDPQTGVADVWMRNIERGTSSRFTSGLLGVGGSSAWAPDGRELAYASVHPSAGNFYRKGMPPTSTEQALVSNDSKVNGNNPRVEDWSSDKRYIVVQVQAGRNREDLWAIPSTGEKPFPVMQSQASERNARFSPSGQWLAYASDETGRSEVYVQNFPEPGQRIQVSTAGGDFPVWSRDGRELYFIGADQKMMAVTVKTTTSNGKSVFEPGVPKPLFDARVNDAFDVSKDGRFLMAVPVEQSSPTPLTIVLNWQALLKR